MDMSAALAANLVKIREFKGLTQESLAKKMGVSRQTIYNLENQKTGFGLKVIKALATALEVEETELVAAPGASVESRVRALESQALPRELTEAWNNADDDDRELALSILRGDEETERKVEKKTRGGAS